MLGRRWVRIAAVFVAAAGLVANTSARSTPAAAADPLVYVALGDSYTSGPLVLPHDTTWVPQDCGQSVFNYPHLAERTLKVDVFKDVSCGSATIDDFSRVQHAAAGSPTPPQFDALNKDVDIVTVGIAGNDVGFVGLALDCVRLEPPPLSKPCTPDSFDHGVDTVSRKIAATATELGVALQRIHSLSPHAAVFVVSYPDALPDDGVGCYPYLPILNEDMPYLVAKFKEMNAMLRTTAAANGSTYVDIYTSSIGHDACRPPALAWVNGAVLVPPSFPAHPNLFSFEHSAPVVAATITAKLTAQSKVAIAAAPTTTSPTSAPTAVRAKVLPRTGGSAPAALIAAAAAVLGIAARRRYRSAPHSA